MAYLGVYCGFAIPMSNVLLCTFRMREINGFMKTKFKHEESYPNMSNNIFVN